MAETPEQFIERLERAGWRVCRDFRLEGDEIIATSPAVNACDFLVNIVAGNLWCIPTSAEAHKWFLLHEGNSPSAYAH